MWVVYQQFANAFLAQLDRAPVFETVGYKFESCKALYFILTSY